MSKAKVMLGNAVEISLIFCRNLCPLVLGCAPNHFVLGAQLAPGEKRLVCIPAQHHEQRSNPGPQYGVCFVYKNVQQKFEGIMFGTIYIAGLSILFHSTGLT